MKDVTRSERIGRGGGSILVDPAMMQMLRGDREEDGGEGILLVLEKACA